MYQQDLSHTPQTQDVFSRVQRTYSSNYSGESLSPTQLAASIPISVIEDEFKQQARRMAYQQLLYRMFGNQFECTPISGGFSGSSVVKISPYDQMLGTREEAVIVKLDSATNIKTEVTNSLLAHKALGDIAARILGEPIYYHSELDGNDYGAFKMELAGACWYIPEFSTSSSSSMINTFKDSIVFESEEAVLSRKQTAPPQESVDLSDFKLRIISDGDHDDGSSEEGDHPQQVGEPTVIDSSTKLYTAIQLEGSRPYGSISAIIKEIFGLDGSATRSLRRFEATTTDQPLKQQEQASSRRVSKTDPNHPSGGEFLAQRLPVEIKADVHTQAVLQSCEWLHSNSPNPYALVNKALSQVKSGLMRIPKNFKIIRGFCHGDLNGSNIVIDAMEGMWMIDFATARKLPLTSDLAKLESSLLFEYCFVPIEWTCFLSLRDLVPIEVICKWFRVDFEDEKLVIDIFETLEAYQVRSENDLDKFFLTIAGNTSASWKSVRRLRARLWVAQQGDENSVKMSDLLSQCCEIVGRDFLPPKIVPPETGQDFEASKVQAHLSSLQFGIYHCLKMRKYCLSDIANIWRSMDDSNFDESIGLNNFDISILEFGVLLLREFARIVRYEDVPPWMKIVVSQAASQLAQIVTDDIHRLVQEDIRRVHVEATVWSPIILGSVPVVDTPPDPMGVLIGGLSRLISTPSSVSEEEKKYTRYVKSRFGHITDFVSGRQLDVVHHCAQFKLFSEGRSTGGIAKQILSLDHMSTSQLNESVETRFLVRAIPGGGKTCLLRQLAISAIENGGGGVSIVPLYIPVSDLCKEKYSKPELLIIDWIKSISVDDSGRFNYLLDHWEGGKLLLLIDGLDDANSDTLPSIMEFLTTPLMASKRIVVTYKTDSLSEEQRGLLVNLGKFMEAEIAPLDSDQRQFVVRARLGAGNRDSSVLRFESFYEVFERSTRAADTTTSFSMIRSPSFLSMLICYWQEKQQQHSMVLDYTAPTTVVRQTTGPMSLSRSSTTAMAPGGLQRTTTAVTSDQLHRTSSPQWSVGSSPTGASVGMSGNTVSTSISDVYRVALSVLVHRYQVVQQTDRSRVREFARRLMDLLRFLAFKMLVENVTEISDDDVVEMVMTGEGGFFNTGAGHHPLVSEWKNLSLKIKSGKFLLLTYSQSKFKFSLPGMIDFLAADYLINNCSVEVEDLLPKLVHLVCDSPHWNSAFTILGERSPLKLVRIFERKLVNIEWETTQDMVVGDNVLHVSARIGYLPIFQILNKSSLLESLINRPNSESLVPLHEAARFGRADICSLLLASRADVWASTDAGWSPLHFAASSHNREVCGILLAAQQQSAASGSSGSNQLSRLSLSGLRFGERVLSNTITASEFMQTARYVFPELSYFRGRSDTTPDASASVQLDPSEIEYRRTMGAMLSVYWICADRYEDFVRSQPGGNTLTRDSWNLIREWIMEKVKLTTPESVDAMLSLMAIHDLGKLKDFRHDLAPDFKDHDAAMKFIIQTTPEVLPSLCRLGADHQYLVRSSLGLDFNFGQFVQAENLPCNLLNIQELIAAKGEEALAFYLFHIFADMSGIMGAKTLEGAVFMTETMYANFRLGIDALGMLGTHSVTEVYNFFLDSRAKLAGLPADVSGSPEARAVARLACQSRVFDIIGGSAVSKSWNALEPEVRTKLIAYLNRDGIVNRPGFLIYYAPAFMENARGNSASIGLKSAMEFLCRIYAATETEFVAVGGSCDPSSGGSSGSLKSVVVVHIAEAAEMAKKNNVNLDSVCFRLVRSGGLRKLNEATLRISPWRRAPLAAPSRAIDDENFNRISQLFETNTVNPRMYPEIDFYNDPSTRSGILDCIQLLSLVVRPENFFIDPDRGVMDTYDAFVYLTCATSEDQVSRKSWNDLRLICSVSDDARITDLMIVFFLVRHMGSVHALLDDLGVRHGTVEILKKFPSVLPSFNRLSEALKMELSGAISGASMAPSVWDLVTCEYLIGENSTAALPNGWKFIVSVVDILVAGKYTESVHNAIWRLRDSPSLDEYISFRGMNQGVSFSMVASPRSGGGAILPQAETWSIIRVCCLANIHYPTGGSAVLSSWTKLSNDDRAMLMKFLRPLACRPLEHVSDYICACKLNSRIGVESALKLLARILGVVGLGDDRISLEPITDRAKKFAVQLPFENIQFEVRDSMIIIKNLIPVSDMFILAEMTKQAMGLTTNLLTMSHSESSFREDAMATYPELILGMVPDPVVADITPDPTAVVSSRQQVLPREIEYKRTINSIMAVYWVLTDTYDTFVRGQSTGKDSKTLGRSSWFEIREWVMDNAGLSNPEIVDAVMVLLVVNFCGKAAVLAGCPQLVPSFNRLSDAYKAIVLGICGMTFNFGQFIQCENLPIHLNDLKAFVGSVPIENSGKALCIYFVFIFFQMSGLLGAKSTDGGCMFMTESRWRNFKLGVDVIVESYHQTADVIYEKYLIRRGASMLDSFRNKQVSAMCRLYNLARLSKEADARKMDSAFQRLDCAEQAALIEYLNRGSSDAGAIMLVYAPAFLENMRINGTIDPVAQLKMFLRVYQSVEAFVHTSSVVVANVREAAVWARDVQFSDSITQLNEFDVKIVQNQHDYLVLIVPSSKNMSDKYM